MELLKQKSKDISETDILLKAMKDLLNKLDEEEKKVEALKQRRNVPVSVLLTFIFVILVCFDN